jgi:hypothetical protein
LSQFALLSGYNAEQVSAFGTFSLGFQPVATVAALLQKTVAAREFAEVRQQDDIILAEWLE